MANSPRKAVKKVLSSKQDQLKAWPMQLGDNEGNIAVPDRPFYVYVHDEGGQVAQAYCPAQLNQYNLPVLVGYDPYQPGVFQVIGVRNIGGAVPINAAPKHGQTHEWMGGDTVWVYLRQWMPLRITPAGGLNIVVMRTITWLGDQYQIISPDQAKISLSGYVPNGISIGRYILVTVDTTGAIVLTAGTEKTLNTMTTADIPAPPEGTKWLLGAVRLYSGQTEIAEGISNTDIVDLRYPLYDQTSGGGGGTGDMTKAVYDQNDNGIVDNAEALGGHPASDFSPSDHTHPYGPHASRHMVGGDDELDLTGLAGLLATPQTPAAHAASHQAGGTDAIKLDTLALPDDTTTLNASTSCHGLMPKLVMGVNAYRYSLRGNGSWGQEFSDESIIGGRLTLASGEPDNVQLATSSPFLYYTPYRGSAIGLLNASRAWQTYQFTEMFVTPANTLTGDVTTGMTTIQNPNIDLSQIIIGCNVSGSGLQASTRITAVDLASNTITINKAATGSFTGATYTLSFYGAAPFDVFAYPDSNGDVKLYAAYWTTAANRGWTPERKGGAIFRNLSGQYMRYLGVVYTNWAGGSMWNKDTNRHVFNFHNRILVPFIKMMGGGTTTWTTTSSVWESLQGDYTNELGIGIPGHPLVSLPIAVDFICPAQISANTYEAMLGIGFNDNTVNVANVTGITRSTLRVPLTAKWAGVIPAGDAINHIYPLQRRNLGGTATYIGSTTEQHCAMTALYEV